MFSVSLLREDKKFESSEVAGTVFPSQVLVLPFVKFLLSPANEVCLGFRTLGATLGPNSLMPEAGSIHGPRAHGGRRGLCSVR